MPKTGPYGSAQYLSHSKLQSPLTTKWLNEHYEVAPGVSLPRSSLYQHYFSDFCQKSVLSPVNAASFGKIIRHNFPNLKTRRLGTRGQSKYHYYGITIKETSPYHDTLLNNGRQATQNYAATKATATVKNQTYTSGKSSSSNQHCLMSSSGGTLLPSFPKIETLTLPPSIPSDKVRTFLIMYRAHCQRILDTILRANFGEVQKFFIHFWQGMPEHILTILSCPEVIKLIGVCDEILFKAIGSVLIPGVLQPLPASLTQAIRQFATQLNTWLESSLAHFPEKLKEKKIKVANVFSKSLRRKTSLTHLAQAARTVLHSSEPVLQMVNDWRSVDFNKILKQTLWTFSSNHEDDCRVIETFLQQFTQLLEQQAAIDQYAEWANNLVDTCLKKYLDKNYNEEKIKEHSRQFLLKWSFFGNQVMRELTLKSAQSFGSFHLLHILLEDYIVYCVETKITSDQTSYPSVELENKQTSSEQQSHEIETTHDAEMKENSETQVDMELPTPAQFQQTQPKSAGTCPDDKLNTPVSSVSVNQTGNEVDDRDKAIKMLGTGLNMMPEARSELYYRANNQMNNYLPGRRFGSVSMSPYSMTSPGQNMSNYEAFFGSMNTVRSSGDLKSYAPYISQNTHSYIGRYGPPSMVAAGSTIYARNFHPSTTEHYRNDQLAGRMNYERRFQNRVVTETPASVLGGL
ncbi:transcription factor RFX4-like isoform X2 [Dendronephthya gigantea]|nr:transcription factor RFX4-like isoform X2 [Dendronephthya gigantea]